MDDNGKHHKDELLKDFFAAFNVGEVREEPVHEETHDFISAQALDSYEAPVITDATALHIQRLQKISQSIEAKTIRKPRLPNPHKEYKIPYQKNLNKMQYMVATTINGPLLVIAGAGSGKTHTVVYRVSYLLENGIPPEKILLLTFTRRASNEMIRRVNNLLQNQMATKVMAGTFHAFSNHILRAYAGMLGIPASFTIIDTSDAEDIIDLIRQEMKFEKKSRAFPRKGKVNSIISKSRNCHKSIKDVILDEYITLAEFIEDIEVIAKAYKGFKRGNNIFDYDDLLEFLRDALRDNHAFRHRLQALYHYIMVDEFQDTNRMQKEIVDLLAKKHKNVMVVGDDSQSIYAFRGANFENILRFPETYPSCKVVKLEQNYRSNQDILNFTNNIANSAIIGYQKSLFSRNNNPNKPIIGRFYSQEEEAEYIVQMILQQREKGIPLNKISVLYRSTFHGSFIQAELLAHGLPFIVIGGIRFIERRHIKDIIAYLRILLNPLDAVSWNRVLKLLPGVGRVTTRKIIEVIHKNNGAFDFSSFSKRKYGASLQQLEQTLNEAVNPQLTIAKKVEILRQYYEPLLKSLESDYENRLPDLDVLFQLSAKYSELDKFLSDFALDPPSNKFQNKNEPLIGETDEKPITLSTIHSAKGLEWHTVFVPHLLDGLFPSTRAQKDLERLEEERRLFYVACSRAKEQLFLTLPSYYSGWDSFFTKPCRFILEIEKNHYKVIDEEYY